MVAAAVVVGSSRPVPAGPGDHGDGERCRRGREVPDQHEVVQGLPGATVEEPGLVQSAKGLAQASAVTTTSRPSAACWALS